MKDVDSKLSDADEIPDAGAVRVARVQAANFYICLSDQAVLTSGMADQVERYPWCSSRGTDPARTAARSTRKKHCERT